MPWLSYWDRCDLAWSNDARHMYALLSTLSTSFSPQSSIGSFRRNNINSCKQQKQHVRPLFPVFKVNPQGQDYGSKRRNP